MLESPADSDRIPLATIAREWGRIGCVGFGGPPTHIALLRKLCVEERRWLSAADFEDGIAATNLLPGPASTQLAIYCAWRLRGQVGAVLGGVCFIVPGLVVILGLAALFLSASPPLWLVGAAAGAGAAVPIVAANTTIGLGASSWRRAGPESFSRLRWIAYLLAGGVTAATLGSYLVVVLTACGLLELTIRGRLHATSLGMLASIPTAAVGGLLSIAWVAFKVGALSFGGGFVIIPLMQGDAVHTYHWMTSAQFLDAVALGQVTPGPVVQTVAVVGYAAAGVGGGLLASLVAFTPSFLFVLFGGPYFGRLQRSHLVQAFLKGAGPAAIGAIGGAAVILGLALTEPWQFTMLLVAAGWVLVLRRGVVSALLGAGALGAIVTIAGTPIR
ncbi:MAG TPA: chromate efflux transporter [Candidatus Dormibacteraeota bacterium]|nr:chromate efflux transporter [Candidatus Dormibacteraeota bacterium]